MHEKTDERGKRRYTVARIATELGVSRRPTIYLSRSKSHRRTSGCVAVLVDHAAEDSGAQDPPGVEVMHGSGVVVSVGR